MSMLSLIPAQYRMIAGGVLALALLVAAAGAGWIAQGWRLGEQMAEQERELEQQIAQRDKLHADTLAEIQHAAVSQAQREQEKRLQLERELQASSDTEYRKRIDAEQTAARLRDRLATADLRLSVLLATPGASGASGHGGMPAATGAGCLVDGAVRADIDPGSAQRILGIADRGDRAIIALGACQAYIRKVSGAQ